MIIYFTGSGNSLWTARQIAAALDEPLCAAESLTPDTKLTVGDELVGLVFPVYMADAPWIVKRALLSLRLRADAYCFAVATSSGGDGGKTFTSVDEGLAAGGAHLAAGFDLQMPGNCVPSSDADNAARLAAAPDAVACIVERVRARERSFEPSGASAGPGYVENSYYYGEHSLKRLTMMKNFKVTDACDGCGVCARVCPAHAIDIRDGRAVHARTADCAACYACLHWCPKHATRVKLPVLSGRSQYRHPDVAVRDLVEPRA